MRELKLKEYPALHGINCGTDLLAPVGGSLETVWAPLEDGRPAGTWAHA
jgi:hypothetical protein